MSKSWTCRPGGVRTQTPPRLMAPRSGSSIGSVRRGPTREHGRGRLAAWPVSPARSSSHGRGDLVRARGAGPGLARRRRPTARSARARRRHRRRHASPFRSAGRSSSPRPGPSRCGSSASRVRRGLATTKPSRSKHGLGWECRRQASSPAWQCRARRRVGHGSPRRPVSVLGQLAWSAPMRATTSESSGSHRAGGDVLLDLLAGPGARNRARDARVAQHVPDRDLSQRCALRSAIGLRTSPPARSAFPSGRRRDARGVLRRPPALAQTCRSGSPAPSASAPSRRRRSPSPAGTPLRPTSGSRML